MFHLSRTPPFIIAVLVAYRVAIKVLRVSMAMFLLSDVLSVASTGCVSVRVVWFHTNVAMSVLLVSTVKVKSVSCLSLNPHTSVGMLFMLVVMSSSLLWVVVLCVSSVLLRLSVRVKVSLSTWMLVMLDICSVLLKTSMKKCPRVGGVKVSE